MSFTENLEAQTDEWLMKTVELAGNCQKHNGPTHPLWPMWSAAIHACCAELAKRQRARGCIECDC